MATDYSNAIIALGTGGDVNSLVDANSGVDAAIAAASVTRAGGGKEAVTAVGNSGSTKTLDIVDGNVLTVNNSASCTYTMPSGLTSGVAISFSLIVTNKGAYTAAFTGVKWAAGSAPTLTSGDTKVDIFTFLTVDGGATWYGTVVQDVR